MRGLTGLIAPVTSLRMLKGRLRLFISRSPISTACVQGPSLAASSMIAGRPSLVTTPLSSAILYSDILYFSERFQSTLSCHPFIAILCFRMKGQCMASLRL